MKANGNAGAGCGSDRCGREPNEPDRDRQRSADGIGLIILALAVIVVAMLARHFAPLLVGAVVMVGKSGRAWEVSAAAAAASQPIRGLPPLGVERSQIRRT